MDIYRDELEALRLRVQSLEATLGERQAALQARDAQLREAEARAERNLRSNGMFNDAPVAPKRSALALMIAGSGVAALAIGALVVLTVLRTDSSQTTAQRERDVTALRSGMAQSAELAKKAEARAQSCEQELSEAQDQVTKLRLADELESARSAASSGAIRGINPPPGNACNCAAGDLACNMACAVH